MPTKLLPELTDSKGIPVTYPLYQIDAFTHERFKGNPAAVVPLTQPCSDELMLNIAAENNLSETAFLLPADDDCADYRLRWFTPQHEVDLCGHATLAAAFVLFEHLQFNGSQIRFSTQSGLLTVNKNNQLLTLDFPSRPATTEPLAQGILDALGISSVQYCAKSRDWLLVLDSQAQVANLKPDFKALALASEAAVIVTAPGDKCDFVSRFFAPALGIDEDPVTGSAHCTLTPYWAKVLGKALLSAQQVSARGGDLQCRLEGDRVFIEGAAVTYLKGEIA